jgi:hypothetical protein
MPKRTFSPVWRRMAASRWMLAKYCGLRGWVSGISSRLRASGQYFSMAAIAACTASGNVESDRWAKPPGNRLVSTGASLKPALRRSTEQ